jgi:predicted nicotinamide N-methyase
VIRPGGNDAPALFARFDVTTTSVDVNGEEFEIQHPRNAEELIDEAAFNRDERLPYWADIWPASLALARAVRAMPGEGRSFLELGCGAGLVTAAALRAGFEVTASDYYEDALAFTRVNGEANAGRVPATMLLDWRDIPDRIQAFDIVAAADVLYERAYGPLVARAIAGLLATGGSGWVADPGRVGSAEFFDALHGVGLRHVSATFVSVSMHGREQSVIVHEVTR